MNGGGKGGSTSPPRLSGSRSPMLAPMSRKITNSPSGMKKKSASRKKADVPKDSELAAMMKNDPDLSLIENSHKDIDDAENDVVFTANVDENAEKAKMLVPTSLVNMTQAELELANWRNTHVLNPDRAISIVKTFCGASIPGLQIQQVAKEVQMTEYLTRGFQELLCTILPDLVSIAKHRTSSKRARSIDNGIQQEQSKVARVELEDVDIYCSVSRTLSRKVDVLLNQVLQDLEIRRYYGNPIG